MSESQIEKSIFVETLEWICNKLELANIPYMITGGSERQIKDCESIYRLNYENLLWSRLLLEQKAEIFLTITQQMFVYYQKIVVCRWRPFSYAFKFAHWIPNGFLKNRPARFQRRY